MRVILFTYRCKSDPRNQTVPSYFSSVQNIYRRVCTVLGYSKVKPQALLRFLQAWNDDEGKLNDDEGKVKS